MQDNKDRSCDEKFLETQTRSVLCVTEHCQVIPSRQRQDQLSLNMIPPHDHHYQAEIKAVSLSVSSVLSGLVVVN